MRSWSLNNVLRRAPQPFSYRSRLDGFLRNAESTDGVAEQPVLEQSLEGKPALQGGLSQRLAQSLLEGTGTVKPSATEAVLPTASDFLNKQRPPPRNRSTKKKLGTHRDSKERLHDILVTNDTISSVLSRKHIESMNKKVREELTKPVESRFSHDSSLVPEAWAGEPWKDQVASSPSGLLLDRSSPPHIEPETTLRGGVIEHTTTALVDVPPPSEHHPVSQLTHGLDRVLFNPGVHWLQDPRSRVYNFTPWLEFIPKVNNFAFERLTRFIKSSRDEDLRSLANQHNKKFAGSTSSLSGLLSHIYFLISEHKQVELSTLSQHFRNESPNFTSGQKMPATVVLKYDNGTYAIDSHSAEWDDPDKNVLTWMGTLLENFLTKSPNEFQKYIRDESQPLEKEEEPTMREAYRYAKSDKFVMRSQLDCQDKRLPGTGVFDIKTRACVSVRMDIMNYEENSGYMIKSQYGLLESFEREYYDLIRSAFLKYSFQVRIGNMDGVMVTYHNTERIFGFQYISLDEMDERLLGPVPGMGDKVFSKSVKLLEHILESATALMPNESIKVAFETLSPGKVLQVYVEPETWDQSLGPSPMARLSVTLRHFLDGEEVRASAALRSTTQEWTMAYEITRSKLPQDIIRSKYDKLEGRKKRSIVLPSSVSLDEAQDYWDSISFHKREEDEGRSIMPSMDDFTLANTAIQKYRALSKEGRLYTEELEKRHSGKPKVVLGAPTPEVLEESAELNQKTLSNTGP